MLAFNLLPWRVKKKQKHQKQAVLLAGGLTFFVLVLVVVLHYQLVQQVSVHQEKIAAIEEQLKPYQASGNLLDEQALQEYKQFTQRFFTSLAKTQVLGFCFTQINRKKNKLYFYGKTNSAHDITQFLQAWPALILFSELNMYRLEKDDQNNTLSFEWRAPLSMTYPLVNKVDHER